MPSSLLIKDVRIFDGEREIPSGSVLIQDGMIRRVSDASLGHKMHQQQSYPSQDTP